MLSASSSSNPQPYSSPFPQFNCLAQRLLPQRKPLQSLNHPLSPYNIYNMTENNKNSSSKPIGKWDKIDDEARKEENRAKYLQNEEKRKQLAVDNLRRRREVQKRRKEEFEMKRVSEEMELKSRKQSQEEAYLRYLKRENVQKGMNLYDRAEAEKKMRKEGVVEVRSTRKWGEPGGRNKSKEKEKEQEVENNSLMALDLDVHATKDMEKIKKFYQQGKEKLKLLDDFHREWEGSKGMAGSLLLDSLDLDKDTIINSKAMGKGDKAPLFESYEKMKESFLSESLDLSNGDIEESEKKQPSPVVPIKKQKREQPKAPKIEEWGKEWDRQQIKEQIKQPPKPAPKNKFNQDLKELIGFDSLDQSSAMWHIDAFKKKQAQIPSEPKKQQPIKKEVNEEEIKAEHKNVELLNWASRIEEVHESGVSSNMSRKPRNHILQNLNQRIKSEKANVVQQEQRLKALKEQDKRKSLEQRREAQRRYSDLSLERARKNKSIDKSLQKGKRLSNQKLPPINGSMKGTKFSNITAPSFTSKLSKQSRMTAPVPNVPLHPRYPTKSNNPQSLQITPTICSEDNNMDIEEFIREDLVDLNERERLLQQEIKSFHFANRNKVKEVESKYEIETNYKNTNQLLKKQPENLNSLFECVTQDQLEDSLVKLDELLKQQGRKLTYLSSLPIQEERKESEDSLRVSDSLEVEAPARKPKGQVPASKDEQLLTQIIKLAAQNIGEDSDHIDLDRLREKLSKMTNSNSNTNTSAAPVVVTQKQEIPQERQEKPQIKKDPKELSYIEIMKIKNSASNDPKKVVQREKSTEKRKSPIKEVQRERQLELETHQPQGQQGEPQITDKISVNERLRRLLLE